ncbi:histone-lysine N-methyltransferase ASH1L-like isoform X1 [Sander lucioperca]|uniref:histone-lysine N-methyltransferase ASH1L-like isoform X1 n=1 Tax=Sander lucioperca TaxID=283035 RepID=UPI001653BC1B|nr:histone-lysine N-methyltransferase ASH1L-like isoform X1 [Sander lucioperca]XP_035862313.1 histone-lysine N-methyltransferase ASH1L-like isoform X1 [Sander lucioperca]XP_035862314.1 histone-lysine N-methyltransferase ASH1L-like isoform X1 [Sander lucioperca]XP_035862315.1 histone-lysine N-methyltransferase ASH1L-like isoform X1 [Sander lucioperca]
MDQRVKGGTPPTTNSTLDPTSASEDSEVAEKKRRGEGENGDVGEKDEEKRGAGKKREGDKGAVLELLIEGRCGSAGQQQLQISGRETGCPEGNVRLRIGLQAKRTKKPPKILESYVCKPTIRTYQRQARGGLLRGDGERGQQNKTSSIPEEATRDQRSGLDSCQTTSKQTASAASPPLASLSLSSASSSSSSQPLSLSSTFTTASITASVPTITSQGTKSAKQVPIKLADKTEVNSNGSCERVKKEKLPTVNGQPVSAGNKPCSPTTDQTASTTPPTTCIQVPSQSETRNKGKTSKKHNGLVKTTKQKGLFNGKGSSDILGTSTSSKSKIGKHSSSSSVSSMDSLTRPLASTSSHKELSLSNKSRPDSPSSSSVTPKPQSSPTLELSSAQSQDQGPILQPPLEKKRDKERKAKKEKRKDKKSKRDRLEDERAKSDSRKEEGKKKKKEKGKDGKSRHSKEKDERQVSDDTWRDELKIERGKAEKKRDKVSPDRQRTEDNKSGEPVDSGKLNKTCKVLNSGRPDEIDKMDDSCKPVEEAEPATATGDTSKSKEQDVSRHSTVPPSHPSSSAPPSLPTPSARAPVSPPSSPQEQDSRPLKKRKARRPSWTKLVHRAQRVENQEAPSDFQHNPLLSFSQNPKTSLPAKATIQQADESHPSPSSSFTSSSYTLSSATTPISPKQSHPTLDHSPPVSRCPITPARKRGRPKSHSSSLDEPPPKLSPNAIPTEVPLLGCDGVQKAPVLEPSPKLQCATQSKSSPKKRGRPPKQPLPEDQSGDALNRTDFPPPEKGNRQLKIRRLINEMKKRKKRRLHKVMLSGYVGKEGRGGQAADGETSLRMCKSIEATTVHTLSALSSSFGSKLGPQINVSKRGTIYMGKRRGRKPKAQTANLNSNSKNATQSSLFTNPSETSLFSSNQPQPHPSHPFPSPSLTHSSGAQSPYSEGSLTEPTSSLLFSHPFSLPSPSSSCTSPRPPSSSSLSPFVKKSCPCQGRHHFPFHQSSCKLSCPTPPLHHAPGSPGHRKEATPSPRSESHSEETLPSDSGIGTDNNSVSERAEMRGVRGMLRLGQGSGVILGGQRHPSSLVDRPSPVSSPLSLMPRHTNQISNSTTVERHRDRHRHRRRDYDRSSSCTCLCPCPCPGHNKCTHSDYYSCLGQNALKRQKNKHKKKQLHMQDPEFLAELEDLVGQFSEVHIGRRSWARTGLGQGFDGSGNAAGGRRHHSSSHSLRSNIFRINLNGFYSPHPSSYSANPSFSPQPFYSCQPVHCNRKPDRRQCGCPSKFQETIENMGFYSSYSPATTLYHHLPSSYPLPSPHQYAPHQPHHAHFLLNPARFHRRRSRLLREGALGGEVEGDLGGGSGGGPHLSSGFTSSLSCGCGRSEHKHKHKHHHRHCERDMDEEEELHEDEEEDGMERERLASSKSRSGFILGQGEKGRKGARGMRSMLSKESPWLCENGNDSFSSAAAATSSSASSSERYKHTSLTSLGLGSSHLSSFGGSWGGIGKSWTKFGGLGGTGFGNSTPIWRGFTGEQHTGRMIASEGEDEEGEDESPLYRTSPSPTHTNLFTSATMATGERGLRAGLAGRNTGSGDRSWRRDEPAWTERRESGLQGDSRSRGQQKSVPTPDGMAGKNKRRPGRPRKHPLPSTVSSPTHSSAAPSMSSPDLLPGHNRDGREGGGRKEERGPERDRRGDMVQQVTELELQARRKRGRKRKHGDSLCHQSVAEDKPECDTPPECFSQSDVVQAPSQPVTIQRDERADGPPRKKFLRAGFYSDDYKTTDPPSQAQQLCRENMEYTPGENGYSLLPAPIHVGKYLRLKRINFQLPYDVMWLWQNNQLQRQPAVPLKRKRRYCRLKERTVSSQQTAEESSSFTSLFPHLVMEPLTSSERSFVVKHHVFLVRNWELVRDRQIRLRIEKERERDAEGEDSDSQRLSCDGANGDDSHIKSDQQVGVEVTVISSDPHHQSQDTSSSLTASLCPTKTKNREEEEGGEEKRGEEEVCSREQRRKRLNDLLLTLQQS